MHIELINRQVRRVWPVLYKLFIIIFFLLLSFTKKKKEKREPLTNNTLNIMKKTIFTTRRQPADNPELTRQPGKPWITGGGKSAAFSHRLAQNSNLAIFYPDTVSPGWVEKGRNKKRAAIYRTIQKQSRKIGGK